jgi:hypothetical protein
MLLLSMCACEGEREIERWEDDGDLGEEKRKG